MRQDFCFTFDFIDPNTGTQSLETGCAPTRQECTDLQSAVIEGGAFNLSECEKVKGDVQPPTAQQANK